MPSKQVAVIILNWNGVKDTLACLASLRVQLPFAVKITIYVVDNASTDNSVDLISRRFPEVKLLVNQANLGFTGGNNVGLKQAMAAGADYYILLNNDTTVDPALIKNLITGAEKNRFDIASPKIYFYPGCEFHHRDYSPAERGRVIWYAGGRIDWANVWPSHIGVDEVDHGQFTADHPTEFATGCCMLITRPVLHRIGLLDTVYRAYFEDNDFCRRAAKQGFSIGFVADAKVWHKNAASTGGSGSQAQHRLLEPSRLIFAIRYAPLRAKLAVFKNYFVTHLPSVLS